MSIKWKNLDKKATQIEGITSKLDFYILTEKKSVTLDIFNHKIKDNDKAHLMSVAVQSVAEGKALAKAITEFPELTKKVLNS